MASGVEVHVSDIDKQGAHLIDTYRDQLIKCLDINQLLHSSFISEFVSHRNVKDGASPAERCDDFLNRLTRCGKPGWFTAFTSALEQQKYTYLVGLLREDEMGQSFDFWQHLQKLFSDQFCLVADVSEIVRILYAGDHIGKNDKQLVLRENIPIRGMMKLIDIVSSKEKDWPIHLIGALYEAHYPNIIKAIDPDLLVAVETNCTREFIEAWAKKNGFGKASPDDGSDPVKLAKMAEYDSQNEIKIDIEGSPDGVGLTAGNIVEGLGHRPPVSDGMSDITGMQNEAGDPVKAATEMSDDDEDFHDAEDGFNSNMNMESGKDSTYVKYLPNIDEGSSIITNSRQPAAGEDSSIITNSRQPAADVGVLSEVSDVEEESDDTEGESPAIELREYQKELMDPAVEGKNTVIVAPTGSGKTLVAVKIIEKHIAENWIHKPKVVFLVPTVALVKQQCQVLNDNLNKPLGRLEHKPTIIGLSGDSQMNSKDPIRDTVKQHDIFVLTPALLEQWLAEGEVDSICNFALILFDECHHTFKSHPYNRIMSHYHEEKLKANSVLPQVVGMTASVGVGQSRKDSEAVEHIMRLCANLDAVRLQTVRRNKDELAQYENRPKKDIEQITGRLVDPFFDEISKIMKLIELRLQNFHTEELRGLSKQQLEPPAGRGTDAYTQWLSALKKPIAAISSEVMRRVCFACSSRLRTYNNALLINADCRTKDAMKYLLAEFAEFDKATCDKLDDTDKWLRKLFEDKKVFLQMKSEDPRYDNPKLKRLQQIILEHSHKCQDMRAIVFCKTREMTAALQNWMMECDELYSLNPKCITGTSATSDRKGMTTTQQHDALQYFKDGKHKVIIATSVAEEGLDIQKCDLVLRYIHVTNMVAHVQARGRARAQDARYITVGNQDTVTKDMSNEMREEMQSRAIERIQIMTEERFKLVVKHLQAEAKIDRDMDRVGKMVEASHSGKKRAEFELRCFKCNEFATFTSDIRTIKSSHHVVIDEDFDNKVDTEPHPNPREYDGWCKTGKLFCKECHNDWGINALYRKIPFSVIKIDSFVVIDEHGRRDTYSKWKKTPFALDEMSIEDMQARAQQAMDALK